MTSERDQSGFKKTGESVRSSFDSGPKTREVDVHTNVQHVAQERIVCC